MSQRCVEILLGRILTDEDFRREFFPRVPDGAPNFAFAATHGLSLTEVERAAVARLERRRVDTLARTLDPRIARSSLDAGDGRCGAAGEDGEIHSIGNGERTNRKGGHS